MHSGGSLYYDHFIFMLSIFSLNLFLSSAFLAGFHILQDRVLCIDAPKRESEENLSARQTHERKKTKRASWVAWWKLYE